MGLDGIDPYLERQFRLADRRGLLQGRVLSRPQEYAVEAMLISEDRAKARNFVDQLKLAVVSHDPAFWLDRLFPQWASKRAGSEDAEIIEDGMAEGNIDPHEDGPVEWRFEPMDPAEAEEMLAEMLANRSSGSVTADELEDEGWV